LENIVTRLIEIRRGDKLVVHVKVDFAHQSVSPLAGTPRPLGTALFAAVEDETVDLYQPENRGAIGRFIEPENRLGIGAYRQQESQQYKRSDGSFVTHCESSSKRWFPRANYDLNYDIPRHI
jgi:hypothetical protein